MHTILTAIPAAHPPAMPGSATTDPADGDFAALMTPRPDEAATDPASQPTEGAAVPLAGMVALNAALPAGALPTILAGDAAALQGSETRLNGEAAGRTSASTSADGAMMPEVGIASGPALSMPVAEAAEMGMVPVQKSSQPASTDIPNPSVAAAALRDSDLRAAVAGNEVDRQRAGEAGAAADKAAVNASLAATPSAHAEPSRTTLQTGAMFPGGPGSSLGEVGQESDRSDAAGQSTTSAGAGRDAATLQPERAAPLTGTGTGLAALPPSPNTEDGLSPAGPGFATALPIGLAAARLWPGVFLPDPEGQSAAIDARAAHHTAPWQPRTGWTVVAARPLAVLTPDALAATAFVDPDLLSDAGPEVSVADVGFAGGPALPGAMHSTAPASTTLPAGSIPHLAAQLALALAARADGGTELTLSPEELGQVRVTFTPDPESGDRVIVLLQFDRTETLDLFRRHADQLEAALQAAGYTGASIGFAQGGTGGDAKAEHAPSGLTESPAEVMPPATDPHPRPSIGGASLDLRL